MRFDQLLSCTGFAFFAILFGQSAVDKIVDRKGNLEWLTGHFSQSPFRNIVPLLLTTLTLTEVLAAGLSLVSCGFSVLAGAPTALQPGLKFGQFSVLVILINLLMLFLGQRIAKDYQGAATIAIYFGLAWLLALAQGI